MADIVKSDVLTYVRELIAKEFGIYAKAQKVPSDIRKNIPSVPLNKADSGDDKFGGAIVHQQKGGDENAKSRWNWTKRSGTERRSW